MRHGAAKHLPLDVAPWGMRHAALALLAVLALAAVAGASPQPSPACGFCGDQFESTADEHGVNASVVESHAVVQVHDNGSATWTVRNRLDRGADRFRAGPARLDAVAETLAEDHHGVAEGAHPVDARMDGDEAVLTYRDPGTAERRAGMLVVDYFHHDGYDRWLQVNADTLVVRGPPGTVVANDPASGAVDGRAVTWEGSAEDLLYRAPRMEGYPLVVFGSDDATGTAARAQAAVAATTVPLFVDGVVQYVAVQAALFGGALALVGKAIRHRDPGVGVEYVAGATAVVGAAGTLALVAVLDLHSAGPGVVVALVGGVALHPTGREHLDAPGRLAVAAGLAVVAGWALGALTHALFPLDGVGAWTPRQTVAVVLPFAAMVPLGAALRRDRRTRLGWSGVAVLAFALMPPLLVDFTAPESAFFPGLAMIGFLTAAVAFPVLGALPLSLGWLLGEPAVEESPSPRIEDV